MSHKQFERGSIATSHRIISLLASTVLDADAIKTTIATAATAQSYSGAALNGADVGADHIARPTPSGHTSVAQYPVAVAATSVGSYVDGSTITFTGTYNGAAATSVATVSGTGGNATFVGTNPLDTVSSVAVEAQADTSGAWTFGFNDVACSGIGSNPSVLMPFRSIRGVTSGDVKITCGDGNVDTLPSEVVSAQIVPVEITRVWFSDAATTATEIVILA